MQMGHRGFYYCPIALPMVAAVSCVWVDTEVPSIHPDIQEMIAIDGDTWITTDGSVNYSTFFCFHS